MTLLVSQERKVAGRKVKVEKSQLPVFNERRDDGFR